MSSLMIIQEHDRITFAADTARCFGSGNLTKYRVYNEKVQKVHRAGADMVFISGMTECTNQVKADLNKFVKKQKHVNIELFMQYLNKKYPKEKCRWKDIGLHDIGVTIMSVVNGNSIIISFDQQNNYRPFISKINPGNSGLFVVGFDNSRIYKKALNYIKSLKDSEYCNPQTFISIYQNNYSEAVGGFVQIYMMNSEKCEMIVEQELEEINLKYAYKEDDTESLSLQPAFTSHIHGSKIVGSIITSTGTANGTTTLDGGEFKSVGASYSTTIKDGQIYANYISISQGGSQYLNLYAGGILMNGGQLTVQNGGSISMQSGTSITCNNINGSTPITAGNRDDYLTLLYDSNGGGAQVTSTGNNFRPHSNYGSNSVSCGSPSYLWTQVFAASTTISSSDKNLKQQIASIEEVEKRVALKIKSLFTKFKFNDAVNSKGDKARIHIGVIAQDVKKAFEEEGLNPYDYAMFCSDTWYEKNGSAVDENENMYTKDDEGVTEVTQLGIRYEELLCFIIVAM